MDTLQLEYLIKIDELKSLSRAAQLFNTAYQSLAREMDKLEAELGTKLLIRSNKGCTLTAAGERVLDFAYDVLNRYGSLKEALSTDDSIRMGVDGSYVQPKLVAYVAEHANSLRIQLVPIPFANLQESLENNRVDCFLGYENMYPKTIDYIPLSQDRLVAALSPKHPLCKQERIMCQDLSNQTVFLGKFFWERRQDVISRIRRETRSCTLILDFNMFQLLSKLFSAEAIAIMPSDFLNVLTEEVIAIPFEDEVLRWGLYHNLSNDVYKKLFREAGGNEA